jgi:glycosyltransferase involved in cell wall biosynthesis
VSAAGRVPLSVIVPTFNEQDNIEDCLRSVTWADEVLVVDSFSTDRTLEIARRYASRIIQREYGNSASQKNWAIPQSGTGG